MSIGDPLIKREEIRTLSSPNHAKLYIREIFRHHGIPKQIITDRGPQFASIFWNSFLSGIGSKPSLSTAYHPETDGQSERTNAIIEQYLRIFCNYLQDDWVEWLSLGEFTMNNTVQAATGITPFVANTGFHPRFDVNSFSHTLNDAADKLQDIMKEVSTYLQQRIEEARTTMARYADQGRREAPTYKEGDMVYLSTKNITTRRPYKKLDDLRVGPFKVLSAIAKDGKPATACRLELPPQWTIHPVFHVSLLSKLPPDTFDRQETSEPPNIINDGNEYEVSRVLDSRMHRNKLQYRLRWKNRSTAEDVWEDAAKAKQMAGDLIDEYHRKYPRRPPFRQTIGNRSAPRVVRSKAKPQDQPPEPSNDDSSTPEDDEDTSPDHHEDNITSSDHHEDTANPSPAPTTRPRVDFKEEGAISTPMITFHDDIFTHERPKSHYVQHRILIVNRASLILPVRGVDPSPQRVVPLNEPQSLQAEKIIVHRKCIRVKRSELNELIDLFQCLKLDEKENPVSSKDEEPVTSADAEADAEVEAKSEAQNCSEEEDPHGSPDETIAFHHPADDLYISKDFDIHQMRTKRIRCRYLSNGRYQLALRDKVVAYIEKVLGLWTIRIPKGELTYGVLCEGEELKRDVLTSHAVYTVVYRDQEVDRIEIGRVEWTEAVGCTFRKILGQGGCGLIVEGRSPFSNYAIKLERSECTERSSSEADIALKMSSGPETRPYVIHTERVIPVRDVTQPGDDIIISVMERAHHDLYGFIRAVPSTLDNYKVMEKLVTGVQAIHTAGVLHLDLKPANILMVGKDPKIADWGLSKWINDTWILHGSGTPAYAAPEVLLGDEPNASSDIFSLGRIFYEMITGRQMAHVPVPSEKEEFFEYEKSYNKTLNDELQWIDCSTMRRLLFTMMMRDVEERPTTEGVLFELALLSRPKSPVQKRMFKARRSSRQL
ncbi:retrotransposable element protein [Planoprotostelium fungivorum]|uniref:Retrotransposable element protein n=1 Tax=Planoprotostelium fungivorum TaxID=1890364 RepID=A0A2P6NFJ1_9EUKA|nr:retrotransposable element protein [Planoprotostelium fungivorum]